jgi:hypothetical protein
VAVLLDELLAAQALVASCPTEVSCWAVTFTSGKLAVMTLGT